MFKDTLKYLRKSYNLTQKELAQKINVAQSSIAMLENGRNDANASTLTALSDFLVFLLTICSDEKMISGTPYIKKRQPLPRSRLLFPRSLMTSSFCWTTTVALPHEIS